MVRKLKIHHWRPKQRRANAFQALEFLWNVWRRARVSSRKMAWPFLLFSIPYRPDHSCRQLIVIKRSQHDEETFLRIWALVKFLSLIQDVLRGTNYYLQNYYMSLEHENCFHMIETFSAKQHCACEREMLQATKYKDDLITGTKKPSSPSSLTFYIYMNWSKVKENALPQTPTKSRKRLLQSKEDERNESFLLIRAL